MVITQARGYGRLMGRWLLVGAALFLQATLWSAGCSNPASPPAPPAELPSALRFPEEVTIDVSKLSDEEPGSPPALSALSLVGDGPLQSAIQTGPESVLRVEGVIEMLFFFLNQLEIPVSELTTTFERTETFVPEEFEDAPEGFTDVTTILMQIDFADYDFDGDGQEEGCSGHTAATPICFRIWMDDERMLAAVFSTFPAEDDPGIGKIRMRSPSRFQSLPGTEFLAAINYDWSDLENRSSELFATGALFQVGGGPGELTADGSFSSHIVLGQVGPEESAIKTVQSADLLESQLLGSEQNLSNSRWKEDADYWSGSVDFRGPSGTSAETNTCAQISTAREVSQEFCSDLGIDVGDLDFISFPTDADVGLPLDFPEAFPF